MNGSTSARFLRRYRCGLVALDWDHVDLDADPAEIYLPGGIQKETKRDACLDLAPETARQLRPTGTAPGRRPTPSSRVGSPIA
ncbi:hypothetical protein [Halalkalicoccus salilacus]|uniref:hypothetical protein n=1 Tax=Halalkalicoccus sp. GCM10025704 TaxID=3252662 RepID=UPI00360D4B22